MNIKELKEQQEKLKELQNKHDEEKKQLQNKHNEEIKNIDQYGLYNIIL